MLDEIFTIVVLLLLLYILYHGQSLFKEPTVRQVSVTPASRSLVAKVEGETCELVWRSKKTLLLLMTHKYPPPLLMLRVPLRMRVSTPGLVPYLSYRTLDILS